MLFSFGAVFAGKGIATDTSAKDVLPSGDWSLSAHPAYHADQEVNVTSVTSFRTADVVVGRVEVENRGDRTVTGIKLGWSVVAMVETSHGPDFEMIAVGKTPLLAPAFSRELAMKRNQVVLPPMTATYLNHQIVSFGKFARETFGDGVAISGDFRIYVSVEEVTFTDHTYQFRPMDDLVVLESIHVSIDEGPELEGRPCPKQYCAVNTDASPVYICSTSTVNEWCEIKDQGSSCTNHLCTKTVKVVKLN